MFEDVLNVIDPCYSRDSHCRDWPNHKLNTCRRSLCFAAFHSNSVTRAASSWFGGVIFRGLAPKMFASMIFLQTYMGTSLIADGCTSWVLNALQSVCVKQWLVIGLTNKCATNSNRHYNIILWKPDAIFCSTLELKPILVLTLKGLLISLSLRGKRWKTNTKAGHACWKVCFWRANLHVFFLESCLLHILNVFLSSLFFVHFLLKLTLVFWLRPLSFYFSWFLVPLPHLCFMKTHQWIQKKTCKFSSA